MLDHTFVEEQPEIYRQMRSLLKEGNEQEFIDLLNLYPSAIHAVWVFGTWLHQSAGRGLCSAVRYLISKGIDVNAMAGTPETNALREAAECGNLEVGMLLLDAGCKFDLSGSVTNPLFVAIENGHSDFARLLIEHGIDTSVTYGDPPQSARTIATHMQQTETLELLGGPELIQPWIATTLPDYTGSRMTTEKIETIERLLKYPFPAHLREFLLRDFPARFYHRNAIDNDDWQWLGEDSYLFHTVRSYLGYNLKRPWDEEDRTPVFANHIAIGTNGAGDMWCVLKDGSTESVFIYEHEIDQFRWQSATLAEFVNELPDWGELFSD